jgi:hypothetical protein
VGNILRDLRLALALGIGANTVIFSAFDAVLLRPLPYPNPDAVVTVWDSFPRQGVKKIGVTYANFADLERVRMPAEGEEQLRPSLGMLRRLVERFVRSPLFREVSVIDAQVLARAPRPRRHYRAEREAEEGLREVRQTLLVVAPHTPE